LHNKECNGIFQSLRHIILASASPRRYELLKATGIVFDVFESGFDEPEPEKHETPEDYSVKNAMAKSLSVSERYPGAIVIGADTLVYIDGNILGKPTDSKNALDMLLSLIGKWHWVVSGCAVSENNKIVESWFTKSRAFIGDFSVDVATAYIATGEPLDKAGSYAIQGKGAFLVKEIEGSYSNIVGLPVYETIERLLKINAIKVI
jgi:septum formation protein